MDSQAGISRWTPSGRRWWWWCVCGVDLIYMILSYGPPGMDSASFARRRPSKQIAIWMRPPFDLLAINRILVADCIHRLVRWLADWLSLAPVPRRLVCLLVAQANSARFVIMNFAAISKHVQRDNNVIKSISYGQLIYCQIRVNLWTMLFTTLIAQSRSEELYSGWVIPRGSCSEFRSISIRKCKSTVNLLQCPSYSLDVAKEVELAIVGN